MYTKLIEKMAIVGYNINAYIFILKVEHTVFHFSDCRKNITLSNYLKSLKRVLERVNVDLVKYTKYNYIINI